MLGMRRCAPNWLLTVEARLGRALLCIEKHLTPIIAWLANLRVKVAADGIDIDHRGCRPAHCRRVRLCRRARRRYLAGAGGRDRAAGRRAIPGAAARAAASAGETASTALSGRRRVGFHDRDTPELSRRAEFGYQRAKKALWNIVFGERVARPEGRHGYRMISPVINRNAPGALYNTRGGPLSSSMRR